MGRPYDLSHALADESRLGQAYRCLEEGLDQRLVLSEHTVHRRLANILRKLNLSSRGGRGLGLRAGLV